MPIFSAACRGVSSAVEAAGAAEEAAGRVGGRGAERVMETAETSTLECTPAVPNRRKLLKSHPLSALCPQSLDSGICG
jgi:hypothetical protein